MLMSLLTGPEVLLLLLLLMLAGRTAGPDARMQIFKQGYRQRRNRQRLSLTPIWRWTGPAEGLSHSHVSRPCSKSHDGLPAVMKWARF